MPGVSVVNDRSATALAHKRCKGERIGAIPCGWRFADDETSLVAVESEQTVIREMKAMREQRHSYRAIADELTGRGVPTKKGNRTWTHQAVASILNRISHQASRGRNSEF